MYTLILLAGGKGLRMDNSIPKQYMMLAGKPMIIHSLERINQLSFVSDIIIVCSEEYIQAINNLLVQYSIDKKVFYARPGNTRQESVLSGLEKVKTNNVIIHEAARPFVSIDDFKELIEYDAPNVIIGSDIPFTVIRGDDQVKGILTRSELVNVQLPQKFETELLRTAHLKAKTENMTFTEDGSLLHFYYPDIAIKILKGKDYNIKITNRFDMLYGELIYDEVFRRRK